MYMHLACIASPTTMEKRRKAYLRVSTKSIPKSTAWRLKKHLREHASPMKTRIYKRYLRSSSPIPESTRQSWKLDEARGGVAEGDGGSGDGGSESLGPLHDNDEGRPNESNDGDLDSNNFRDGETGGKNGDEDRGDCSGGALGRNSDSGGDSGDEYEDSGDRGRALGEFFDGGGGVGNGDTDGFSDGGGGYGEGNFSDEGEDSDGGGGGDS